MVPSRDACSSEGMRPDRVTFANARGLTLVGHLWRGGGTRAGGVVMAHGFCANKSSRGRFDRLGPALAEAGIAALAFDFAGCGESDDDTLVIAKQAEDVAAAVAFMAARGMTPIALHGHSHGARACLQAALPGIVTMVLTGACTGPVRYDWTRFFSTEELADFASEGRDEHDRRRRLAPRGLGRAPADWGLRRGRSGGIAGPRVLSGAVDPRQQHDGRGGAHAAGSVTPGPALATQGIAS
ncbi:MAG: alpha/beta fold hydrolase [Alphaproteobacteria bacterium]|nr:alpha/beta fold hydrolase [Alphaproteobacteria bacterium]